MRLGFSVRPLSRPDLRSHDSRRWQNAPHLSVSLAYLRDLLRFIQRQGIGMYRMAPDLVPYATHPDHAEFHGQIAECVDELAAVGSMARAAKIRLSFHPGHHVILDADDETIALRAVADLGVMASVLDGMGLASDAVIVLHLGGVYGDPAAAVTRFVRQCCDLDERIRRRLAVENDDRLFDVPALLTVSCRTGLPVVFDYLHHRLHNPSGVPTREACFACMETWRGRATPKMHFSSPRTEWLVEERSHGAAPVVRRARWQRHSDYAHPFEFIDFVRALSSDGDVDILIEARARDLAVLQLRADLQRYAPDLAERLEPPLTTLSEEGMP